MIPSNLNERKILRKKKCEWLRYIKSGKTLKRLDLSVSELCNFGCKHCLHAIPLKTVKINPRTPPFFMDWETAKKAIDNYMVFIKQAGVKETEIYFGDAEPLLNWELVRKIILYCKTNYSSDINIHFRIDTNLSLLTEEVAKTLRRYKVQINTSIDGSKKANDAVRITSEGKGTFDLIMKKCKLLKNINYSLQGFVITITDKNFHLINNSIIEHAKKMGIKTIDMDIDLINPIHQHPNTLANKIFSLHKKADSLGIKTSGTWKMPFLNLINVDPLKSRKPSGLCTSARGESITVAPNGNIFICSHSITCIGSVNKLTKIFSNKGLFLKLIKSRLIGYSDCINCGLESQCAGQCQITREVNSLKTNNKIHQMSIFYQIITKKLLLERLEQETKRNNSMLWIKKPLPEYPGILSY